MQQVAGLAGQVLDTLLGNTLAFGLVFLSVALGAAIAYDRWRFRFARGLVFRRENNWGTVYILQDMNAPGIFKVGYTSRNIIARKTEIMRDMTSGRSLRLAYAIDMTHARQVETVAHRRLGKYRIKSSRRHRGNEWFSVGGLFPRRKITRALEQSAKEVKILAERHGLWSFRDRFRVRRWKLKSK
ncbi:MAG: GIY-YIG nuclease family protein [Roseinatronobacter sp.]